VAHTGDGTHPQKTWPQCLQWCLRTTTEKSVLQHLHQKTALSLTHRGPFSLCLGCWNFFSGLRSGTRRPARAHVSRSALRAPHACPAVAGHGAQKHCRAAKSSHTHGAVHRLLRPARLPRRWPLPPLRRSWCQQWGDGASARATPQRAVARAPRACATRAWPRPSGGGSPLAEAEDRVGHGDLEPSCLGSRVTSRAPIEVRDNFPS